MMLRAFFRKCSAGDLVRVTTTDPATQRDIPDFCRFMDHELKEKGTEKEKARLCHQRIKVFFWSRNQMEISTRKTFWNKTIS